MSSVLQPWLSILLIKRNLNTGSSMIEADYEDGNDATALRSDPVLKLAMDRLPPQHDLCSQSTISRLENLADVPGLLRMGRAMVDLYCSSFRQVPGPDCARYRRHV